MYIKGKSDEMEILNYCSLLSFDEKYSYFKNYNNTKLPFYSLECECLNEKGYDLDILGKEGERCNHSSLLSDKYIINFVFFKSSNHYPTYKTFEEYPSERQIAFNSCNQEKLFVENCNELLRSQKKE